MKVKQPFGNAMGMDIVLSLDSSKLILIGEPVNKGYNKFKPLVYDIVSDTLHIDD